MQDSNTGDSKAIVTNQLGVHEKLVDIVEKHLAHRSQKPFQQHTLDAFALANERVSAHKGKLILDSCCGVGQSTRLLAKNNPEALVIGIDKSAHRIERNDQELVARTSTHDIDNFLLLRADLNDFYRLIVREKWCVDQHYILYPNPWPKSKHVQRRWHGSAVFPEIISIGQKIILRSNWRLYLEEFLMAANIANRRGSIEEVKADIALTPFEAKYKASGQVCWQLTIT
ncbi:tRNA (guanine(46)-N(7))-methyltransferase TrmB [Thalassotalea sediminis]|uniref:tRNA (guanine(46)-N(7))-methyltransferase TrmB n=1 Tax=Thalassotalea sediminis TaxID=1759089 RepID=UPI002572D5CB|nr:SAM-dependent methyltransferase [Thalassotalea sediminis]